LNASVDAAALDLTDVTPVARDAVEFIRRA
jgi:hypothetical protein